MGYTIDPKLTTNYCFSIDINRLKKNNYLIKGKVVSGTFKQRFKQSGRHLNLSVICYDGASCTLKYERNGKEVSYQVPITYSKCNYGGGRPWFICPNQNCRKRVGKLFLRGEYFLCRHCQHLAYETQNMNEAFRMLERAQNIRERLGAESLATVEPFPPRPKGMHFETYRKLKKTYDDLVMCSLGMTAKRWGIAL